MKTNLLLCAVCLTVVLVGGCSSGASGPVYVVDLNKVLDILEKVLQEPLPGDVAAADKKEDDADDAGEGGGAADAKKDGIADVKEDKSQTDAFLKEFAKQLNAAKLIDAPIGVSFKPSGAIEGFVDKNGDMKRNSTSEKQLFEVEIDQERSRLIATDKDGNHHRDRSYRYRPGGFFMGYMFGSMLGRQNRYYTGSRTRPNYSSMKMSPQNYHSSAVSQAKTRASRSSSARSRGGSRGFSSGK